MKKSKIILRYLLLLLAAVVAGAGFRTVVASKLAGNEVPMSFGFGTSVVMSGSMEPELKAGDLIFIKAYSEDQQPEVGDVVVYQTGTMAVVHRVVDIDGDTITTQGDANNAADEPFDISAVRGRVFFSVGWIGYIALFFKTPLGIIAVLAAAVFLMEQTFRQEKRWKEEQVEAMKEEIRRLLEEQREDEKAPGTDRDDK